MKSFFACALAALVSASVIGLAAEPDKDGFVQLFDGKTLNGQVAAEGFGITDQE